jgi:hypothetical protein
MRLVKIAGVGIALILTCSPLDAGQKGNSGNHGPKHLTNGSPVATAGASAKGHSAKPVNTASVKSAPKVAKADVKAPKVDAKAKKGDLKSTTTNFTTTPAPSTTAITPINFASGPVGEKLSQNSALRS